MATIEKNQAVSRLIRAVTDARPDDLVEIYNELFPLTPTNGDEALKKPSALVDRIIAHINDGLEIEEILALWNVIFTMHRGVWFDDSDNLIHYSERTETVGHPTD